MTANELEPKGIFELREMIRRTPGNNPRNLSGGLVTGMDREECIAYMTNGTLPNPERTAGRKASLAAGAYKFFAKGGDPTGEIVAPEATETDEVTEAKDEVPHGSIAHLKRIQAMKFGGSVAPPPAAAPAPGLDALMVALTAAVKADVLASLPPPPKQELDESKVNALIEGRVGHILEASKTTVSEMIERVNAKASDAVTTALADVMRALSTATVPQKARASAQLRKATGKGTNVILDRLLSLCPIGANTANHVLIVGPSGTGKTYQARNFAKMHDWHTEAPIGLHKYLEPHHISGSAAPNDEGTFAFVSGAFRDGFIAASNGMTACILLDEILRASPEMMESLLTTLDPIPTAKGLVYRYRSGKPIKTGTNGSATWTQEVIEAPVEKLTIIATANIGSNYGVFAVDEAFWKRFRVVRIERNGSDERQIIADAANHIGAHAIRACVVLLDESRRAVKAGSLQYPACIRTITRCCSQSATVGELKEQLKLLLTEELTGWTEDGAILQAHADAAQTIVARVESELAKA